jgi:drug/metabolite transporter (DMT)-like permease
MFATNVGGTDRILRIVVGLALIAWFFMDQGTGFWHWAKLIGIVPLATGLMSSCPLYSILGLNTCPVKRA